MEYRIEKDTIGEVKVPSDVYWGAQTERSRNNFKIGPEASMPREVIVGFAYLKKAAAYTNCELGVLEIEKRDLILEAEKMFGKTLVTHQTGSDGKEVKRIVGAQSKSIYESAINENLG